MLVPLAGLPKVSTSYNPKYKPGRAMKIAQALEAGDGRDHEIALALIGLGTSSVNSILNKSDGEDHRIKEEVLELIRTVRQFIAMDNSTGIISFIKSKQGFARRNILNATPISHLVRMYGVISDSNEYELTRELERVIDTHRDAHRYKKVTLSASEYDTGVILPNGVKESGFRSNFMYQEVA